MSPNHVTVLKLNFHYNFFTCLPTFTQLLCFYVGLSVKLLWKNQKPISSATIWKQVKHEVVVQGHDLNIIIYSMSLVKKQ